MNGESVNQLMSLVYGADTEQCYCSFDFVGDT